MNTSSPNGAWVTCSNHTQSHKQSHKHSHKHSHKLPMITLVDIEHALQLPQFDSAAAHARLMPTARVTRRPAGTPGQPRQGAVLLLLYCKNNAWHVVLTRRRENLQSHAGQISFPGGRREAQESLAATALRETHEEVGIPPAGVRLLGQLTTLYIPPSDFEVHPFVGWHSQPVTMHPDPAEVAEILEVPLAHLLDPATQQSEQWELRGMAVEVPFYQVGPHKVWGATAMMLSEFMERLRAVPPVNGGAPL